MAAEKTSVALANTIGTLFKNFPKLLLVNLLFSLPLAASIAVFWAIERILGVSSVFIILLSIIPAFPFYAGVVQVTAHIVRGDEDISIVSDFFSGIKDNFLRFLVHGIVFYAATVLCWFSITLYINNLSKSWIFYIFLGVSVIIALVFLFAFFYIPPMTVTFDISLKNIYKNSFLMSFGELKHNVIAVFGLAIVAAVCATILMCCTARLAVIIATAILLLFILPSLVSFIINASVYKPMYNMIVDGESVSKSIDKKIENKKMGQRQNADEEAERQISEELKKLEIDENADGDEYIFFNGKMMKRSVLLKMKKDAEKESE